MLFLAGILLHCSHTQDLNAVVCVSVHRFSGYWICSQDQTDSPSLLRPLYLPLQAACTRAPQLQEPLERESKFLMSLHSLKVLSGWMKYRWDSGYYHPGLWERIPNPVFPKYPEEALIWAAHRRAEASNANGKWWLSAMHILTPHSQRVAHSDTA